MSPRVAAPVVDFQGSQQGRAARNRPKLLSCVQGGELQAWRWRPGSGASSLQALRAAAQGREGGQAARVKPLRRGAGPPGPQAGPFSACERGSLQGVLGGAVPSSQRRPRRVPRGLLSTRVHGPLALSTSLPLSGRFSLFAEENC